MEFMTSRTTRKAAAVAASVAALVLAGGWSLDEAAAARPLVAASAGATPAPPAPPSPGGALPVRPAGGGGCIIGLNCGCTRNCHQPRPHPPNDAGQPPRSAPAPDPQNP